MTPERLKKIESLSESKLMSATKSELVEYISILKSKNEINIDKLSLINQKLKCVESQTFDLLKLIRLQKRRHKSLYIVSSIIYFIILLTTILVLV